MFTLILQIISNYIKYYLRRNIIKQTLAHSDLIVTKSNALKYVINNELSIDNSFVNIEDVYAETELTEFYVNRMMETLTNVDITGEIGVKY